MHKTLFVHQVGKNDVQRHANNKADEVHFQRVDNTYANEGAVAELAFEEACKVAETGKRASAVQCDIAECQQYRVQIDCYIKNQKQYYRHNQK